MSRGPDAATLLMRALLDSAEQGGCTVTSITSDLTRWASVTFTGARHLLTLAARASPTLDAWLTGLPEAEFALRGHLVADVSVESVHREGDAATVLLEVLTVEER